MDIRRRQEEQRNGVGRLPEELWLSIFAKLSPKIIAKSVMPVCKFWRLMGTEATGVDFMIRDIIGKSGKKQLILGHDPEEEPLVSSLITYIWKRTETLKAVGLKLHLREANLKRVCAALSNCKNLTILDIVTPMRSVIIGPLPPNLKILRSSCMWEKLRSDPPNLQVLETVPYVPYAFPLEFKHGDLRAIGSCYLREPLEEMAKLTKLQYLGITNGIEVKRAADVAMLLPRLKFLVLKAARLRDCGIDRFRLQPSLERLYITTEYGSEIHSGPFFQLLEVPSLYSLTLAYPHDGAHIYGSFNAFVLASIHLRHIFQDSSRQSCKLVHFKLQTTSSLGMVDLTAMSLLQNLRSAIIEGHWDKTLVKEEDIHGYTAIRLLNRSGFSYSCQQSLSRVGFRVASSVEPGQPLIAELEIDENYGFSDGQLSLVEALPYIDAESKDYKTYNDFLKTWVIPDFELNIHQAL